LKVVSFNSSICIVIKKEREIEKKNSFSFSQGPAGKVGDPGLPGEPGEKVE